jgi:hypothetical protein
VLDPELFQKNLWAVCEEKMLSVLNSTTDLSDERQNFNSLFLASIQSKSSELKDAAHTLLVMVKDANEMPRSDT